MEFYLNKIPIDYQLVLVNIVNWCAATYRIKPKQTQQSNLSGILIHNIPLRKAKTLITITAATERPITIWQQI